MNIRPERADREAVWDTGDDRSNAFAPAGGLPVANVVSIAQARILATASRARLSRPARLLRAANEERALPGTFEAIVARAVR